MTVTLAFLTHLLLSEKLLDAYVRDVELAQARVDHESRLLVIFGAVDHKGRFARPPYRSKATDHSPATD